MGIHTQWIKYFKKTTPYSKAFVTNMGVSKVDLLVSDSSNIERLDFYKKECWGDVRHAVKNRIVTNLTKCNTWLVCADSPSHTPQSKQVEGRIRAKGSRLRNGETIVPLTETEQLQRCITDRGDKVQLPDMDRLRLTRGRKAWLTKIYTDMILNQFDVQADITPIKTVVVDGVLHSVDRLKSEAGRIPATYVKRNIDGVSSTMVSETFAIGESDLRWIRWITRICNAEAHDFGLENDGRRRPVVVLDVNDSDCLLIALLHIICFTDINTGAPLCDIYMHYGTLGKWTDFLSKDEDTMDESADESEQKSVMINITKFFKIIHSYFGRGENGFGIQNPVEVFCTLVLLAGDDYVKYVNADNLVSASSPFKGFGPSNIMKLFTQNKRARDEFSSQIGLRHGWESMLGNPMVKKGIVFRNELAMQGFIKRFYQNKLKDFKVADKYSGGLPRPLSKPDGDLLELFSTLRNAEQERINKNNASRARRGFTNSSTAETLASFPTDNQVACVIRRIFWRLDNMWNGGTGTYDQTSDIQVDRNNCSKYGWKYDLQTKSVYLTQTVSFIS